MLTFLYLFIWASLIAQLVKNPPAMLETPVRFLGQEDPLEKGQVTEYSWASLVAQLVRNPPTMWETWVRSLGRSPGEGKGYPLQYSGLENSMDYTGPQSERATFTFTFQASVKANNLVNCKSSVQQPFH